MNRLYTTSLLLACFAAPSLYASTRIADPTLLNDDAVSGSAEDEYATGTHALDQQHWQDAIAAFDRVIAAKGKRADAALYWKAYALNKLGRTSLAGATCAQLRRAHPGSTWNKDCASLLASAGNGTGDEGIYAGPNPGSHAPLVRPHSQPNDDGIYVRPMPHSDAYDGGNKAGSDADLKMLALNSVLQRDPQRALPAIRDILNGSGAPEMKHRALTVLGMSQSADAQQMLRDVATGKLAPTEQRQAIQMLGVFQGKRAGDTLAEIYRTAPDRNIKRSALSAMFISGDAPRLVDLARNEKDLQLKHDIVAQLALMHDKAATDYMLELLK